MPDQIKPTKPVVHIYLARTRDYEYFHSANAEIGILTAVEQDRFERYKNSDDAQNFLIARCVLRQRLSDLLNCSPINVPILVSSAGKPYLDSLAMNNNIVFSVAHCKGHVAIAIAFDDKGLNLGGIGIDIEDFNRIQNTKVLARKLINSHIQDKLTGLSDGDVRLKFMQYWTCLEAYVKCLGSSIAKERAEFDIDTLTLGEGSPIQRWKGVTFVSCRFSTVVLTCAYHFDVNHCEFNYWSYLNGQFRRFQVSPIV